MKSQKHKEWEKQVKLVASRHAPDYVIDEPLELTLDFVFQRPAKPKFDCPATRPDWDKLARFVGDCLEGIFYQDDGRIIVGRVTKSFGQVPGCRIKLCTVTKQEELF